MARRRARVAPADDTGPVSRKSRRIGVLIGAAVAAGGIALTLVGGILGTRRQQKS